MTRVNRSYLEKDVRCPFYSYFRFSDSVIVCEGVEGASSIQSKFKSVKELKEFVLRRCACDYMLCPIYRGLYEYYEEELGQNEQKK